MALASAAVAIAPGKVGVAHEHVAIAPARVAIAHPGVAVGRMYGCSHVPEPRDRASGDRGRAWKCRERASEDRGRASESRDRGVERRGWAGERRSAAAGDGARTVDDRSRTSDWRGR